MTVEQRNAVKLANGIVHERRGWLADDVDTLARAVIAQDEELSALTSCQRCGRGDLQLRHLAQHRASCMSRTDDEQRIDELLAALTEFCERQSVLWAERADRIR